MRRAFSLVGALLVVGAASLLVYWWLPGTATIPDASHAAELTLRAKGHENEIYALDVRGTGRIEGEGEIALILNGAPYKSVRLHGPVDFVWGGDWYSSVAVVRYTPLSPASGSIKLSYRFNWL